MRDLFGTGGTAVIVAACAFYLGWQVIGRALYRRSRLRAELRTYGLARRRRAA